MIETKDGITKITCDKCGDSESHPQSVASDKFFMSGWGLFPRARKYIHKCFHCLSKQHKKSVLWAQENFPPQNTSLNNG